MPCRRRSARPEADVGIVGYGPVGQALAAMLGRAGHRVVVFERWPTLFPYPKAGHLEHDVIRILQSVGAAEGVVAGAWPMTGYDLLDAEGQVLVAMDWNHDGSSGWHSDYSAYQPNLERVLDGIVKGLPNVEVRQGREATSVRLFADHAEVDGLGCRYLVGADGANSLVRRTAGITQIDHGFEQDFLVVHVLPHDPELAIDMPAAAQICDPARPVSVFRRHGNHNPRWEFMLRPGETVAEMETPDTCWRLVAPWGLHPGNADLFYFKVYRFRSLIADNWRAGRALLAGDSAHVMPPFLGQGLCSGFRDAINLSWKLDLVLRGVRGDELLDTYTAERKPHVEALVGASIAAGRLICETDAKAAAERDARLRNGPAPPPLRLPGPPLSIQGRVKVDGRVERFDDVFGPGWRLLAWEADIDQPPPFLKEVGGRVVRLDREMDVDGAYRRWFAELGRDTVLVRPDFYVCD